jgi:hypothetical protein
MQEKPALPSRASEATVASPAARSQPEATITSFKAAQKYSCAMVTLRALVDSGEVSCLERRPHARGECIVFAQATLEAEIKALGPCSHAGCSAPALCARQCGRHASLAAAAEARRPPPPEDRDWRTVEEGMEQKGCSRDVIADARREHALHFTRVAGTVRITCSSLQKWTPPPSHLRTDTERVKDREQVKLLHGRGDTAPQIAEALERSLPTVHADLEALGLKAPRRRRPQLTAEQRAARDQRICAKYAAGHPMSEIEAEEHCSGPLIRRVVERAGLPIRPPGKPAKHPPALPRKCGDCEREFTPTWPAAGEQRFCSGECLHTARAKAERQAAEALGLQLTNDVAAELLVGRAEVLRKIECKALVAERVTLAPAVPGRPWVWGVRPRVLKDFIRKEAARCKHDGKAARFLNPDLAIAHKKSTGGFAKLCAVHASLTPTQVEALETGRVKARAALYARHHGRKPAGRCDRWATLFEVFAAEQRESYERRDDEPRPTDSSAARAAAEEDWRAHPEDWPRNSWPPSGKDPERLSPGMLRDATEKVLKAVKSRSPLSAAA